MHGLGTALLTAPAHSNASDLHSIMYWISLDIQSHVCNISTCQKQCLIPYLMETSWIPVSDDNRSSLYGF